MAVFGVIAVAVLLSPFFRDFDLRGRNLSDLSAGQFTAHLDELVPRLMQQDSVVGVGILLIQQGETIWSGSYGYADAERQRPLTREAILMTHSISKSVTAWGVMKLVQEGRLRLDDPATLHLASLPAEEAARLPRDVTIRRLLSHSAGMPLGALGVHYAPGAPLPPVGDRLTGDEVALSHRPGSAFVYSNSGYGLLEMLIEAVTGRDFAQYMEQEVLRPLGMDRSAFAWSEEMRGQVPTGYDLRGNPVPVYLNPYRASGGLFATLEDVGRFVTAGMAPAGPTSGERLLEREALVELYRPQVRTSGIFRLVSDAYGLGHFLETLPSGEVAAWHGGQGLGWMTHFHAVPERGEGIVILTNDQRSWPLIAGVLRDWGRWSGAGPLGMERIAIAVAGVRAVVGLILLAALWRGGQVVHGVVSGARWPSLSFHGASRARFADLAVALLLLGSLAWALTRDYLYITSVAPSGSVWLAASLALLAVVLLVAALLPSSRERSVA